MQQYFVGIDVGGTFSDVVTVDIQGSITTEKAPTTPEEPTKGMLHALAKVAKKLDISLDEMLSKTARFVYGSTIASMMWSALFFSGTHPQTGGSPGNAVVGSG